jgi:hypothetical protein
MQGQSAMLNPFRWRREHQIAGVIVCLLGGAAGVFFAWMASPYRGAAAGIFIYTSPFLWWLGNAHFYWPQMIFGSVFAGLAFYALELSRPHSK